VSYITVYAITNIAPLVNAFLSHITDPAHRAKNDIVRRVAETQEIKTIKEKSAL